MAKADYIPIEDVEDVDYEVTQQPLTTAEQGLNALLGALNDTSVSGTVSIHRQNGNGKEALQFLESFAPDKYDPDDLLMYIRNTYGGGDYRIHVRQDGKLRANRHISIGEPKKEVSRETHSDNELTRALLERMDRQDQYIRQVMEKPQENEESFLNKMMMYKQLFDNGSSHTGGMKDIMQSVSFLKELGVNVGGVNVPEEKEEGFGDILEKASPVLTALLGAANNQNQPPQYKTNPQPRPTQDKKAVFKNMQLRMGISTLVKAAAKGAPSDFYADFVADNVPESTIKEFMTSPNAMEKLVALDKRVDAHREWFIDLGEHLKGMIGDPTSKYASDYQDLHADSKNDIKGETIDSAQDNDSTEV